MFAFFVHTVTAVEENTSTYTYMWFSDIGKNIADSQAKNWNSSAELIRVIPTNYTDTYNENKIDYYTTEFCYIYRSGNKYIHVLINYNEFRNGTVRTEEMSTEDAEKLGLDKKIPLVSWKVACRNALKVISNYISLDQGDFITAHYWRILRLMVQIYPYGIFP